MFLLIQYITNMFIYININITINIYVKKLNVLMQKAKYTNILYIKLLKEYLFLRK